MKSFSNIFEPAPRQEHDISEFVGFLIASSIIGYMTYPMLKDTGKAFWEFFKNNKDDDKKNDKKNDKRTWDYDDDDDDDKKSNKQDPKKDPKKNDKQDPKKDPKKNDKQDPKKDPKKNDKQDPKKDPKKKSKLSATDNASSADNDKNNEAFNKLLFLAKKLNAKEKNENVKKKNEAMVKLLTVCSFDKDGNELPIEDRINKMKGTMTSKQFKAFENDMIKTYEKVKNDQSFKDALDKAKSNIKSEEYDKMLDDAKKEAKDTFKKLEKDKKAIEKYNEQIKKLKDEMDNDKENKEVKKALEKLKNNPPLTLTSTVSGVSATSKKEPEKEGKYKVQDEEVKDPKTGKTIKVKTYTGPRGGKFYYPEGSPKTPDHKVYVESSSLKNHLLESL